MRPIGVYFFLHLSLFYFFESQNIFKAINTIYCQSIPYLLPFFVMCHETVELMVKLLRDNS